MRKFQGAVARLLTSSICLNISCFSIKLFVVTACIVYTFFKSCLLFALAVMIIQVKKILVVDNFFLAEEENLVHELYRAIKGGHYLRNKRKRLIC